MSYLYSTTHELFSMKYMACVVLILTIGCNHNPFRPDTNGPIVDYTEYALKPIPDQTSIVDQPIMAFGSGPVGALAISPDNEICAVGRGRHLILYSTIDGSVLRVMSGHSGPVSKVVFAKDGTHLLTSGNRIKRFYANQAKSTDIDYTAMYWDLNTGRCEFILKGHQSLITSMTFSNDGRQCVTGDGKGIINIWSLENGQNIKKIDTKSGRMLDIKYSWDGSKIITIGDSGKVLTWRVEPANTEPVSSYDSGSWDFVALSENGKWLINSDKHNKFIVTDLSSGHRVHHIKWRLPFYVSRKSRYINTDGFWPSAFRNDRVVAAAASEITGKLMILFSGGDILEYDLVSGKRTNIIDCTYEDDHYMRMGEVLNNGEYSPDTNYILTSAYDDIVRVWNTSTQKMLSLGTVGDGIDAISIYKYGSGLVIANSERAALYDLQTGAEENRLFPPDVDSIMSIKTFALSEDGDFLIFSGGYAGMFLMDTNSRKILKRYDGPGMILPSSNQYALARDGNGKTYIYDFMRQEVMRSFLPKDAVGSPPSAAISSDGLKLVTINYIGNESAVVHLWNTKNGVSMMSTVLKSPRSADVDITSDGSLIVTPYGNSVVRLWQSDTLKKIKDFKVEPIPEYEEFPTPISCYELSPNGQFLAMGLVNGQVWLWNTQTGVSFRKLHAHTLPVRDIQFTPDNSQFVTLGEEGVALLWNIGVPE